jgi:hypothetical protein
METGFMSFRHLGFAALALAGLALAPSARATTISAGNSNVIVSPTAAAPAGPVLAGPTTTTMTFQSGGATFNIELTSTVWRDNTLVAGGVTFGWKINVLSSTPAGETISLLSVQDFIPAKNSGSGVVEYVTDGGVAPTRASWSGSGLTVAFAFDTPIAAGQSSALLLFRTKATSFRMGTALTQGGAQYTAPTYAAAPIPEPTSLVLAFAGLPMLGLYLRRRARA